MKSISQAKRFIAIRDTNFNRALAMAGVTFIMYIIRLGAYDKVGRYDEVVGMNINIGVFVIVITIIGIVADNRNKFSLRFTVSTALLGLGVLTLFSLLLFLDIIQFL